MFSKRLIYGLKLFTTLSRKVGASSLAFTYDEVSEKCTFSNDPVAFRKLKVAFIVFSLWILASFWLIVKHYLSQDWNRYYATLSIWLCLWMILGWCVVMRWFAHDFCRIMNATFGFYGWLHRAFMPRFDPEKSKLNFLVDAIIFNFLNNVLLILVCGTLYCAYSPRELVFIGGLIPEEYLTLPVRLAVVAFHIETALLAGTMTVLGAGSLLLYITYLTFMFTRELRLGRPTSKYLTSDRMRTAENIRLVCRSFQVLNANMMCHFGYLLMYFYVLNISFPILSIFVLIRFGHQLHVFVVVVLSTSCVVIIWTWVMICESGKFLFVKGSKVISSWKGKGWGSVRENRIMKRFCRSARPVLISHGSQFVLRRITLFNYMKGVTRGICRALLTTN